MAGKGKVAALAVVLLAAPFVALHEGTVLKTYRDPVGIPTACMGETDTAITLRQRFTLGECQALLGASLMTHAIELDKCVQVPLRDHEAAALLSFAYNVGTSAACKSTMVRKLNAGQPWCGEFGKWIYAKGRVLPGLITRRAAERRMCEGQHG